MNKYFFNGAIVIQDLGPTPTGIPFKQKKKMEYRIFNKESQHVGVGS